MPEPIVTPQMLWIRKTVFTKAVDALESIVYCIGCVGEERCELMYLFFNSCEDWEN